MRSANWMVVLGMGAMLAQGIPARAQANTEIKTYSGRAPLVPQDQVASDAQLDKLFQVMRIRQQMAATATMMPQLMRRQFSEALKGMEKDHPELAGMNAEKRQAAEDIMQKSMKQAMSIYTPDEMMADMKAIYQRHLSRSDVEAITAFYGTPAGQHMLDMVPAIMQEFMPAAMEKMQAKMQPLILEMQKELTELAAKQ